MTSMPLLAILYQPFVLFYTKKFKMKQIRAIPKLVFDKHFTDKEFKYYDYACFISILDIDNNEQKFDKSIDNFLQVKMWDIEEDLFENGELNMKSQMITS